ncbi:MAG: PAS domain-containing sensor histidine kinase [Verrucomicrobia bacterium]|nr:PAS domain-containing sensor histidine kinase [Verrucomicrobiota bacterium]
MFTLIFQSVSFALILIGSIVIVGIFTDNPSLVYLKTPFPPMVANTALCFILSGLSMLCFSRSYKKTTVVLASLVLIINLLTLIEHLFHINLSIDVLLFSHAERYYQVLDPGRIAFNTSICFILSSLSIILSVLPYSHVLSVLIEIITGGVAAIAAISLFGYLTGITFLINWVGSKGMALHTSFGLILLGLAIFHYHFLRALYAERLLFAPLIGTLFLSLSITFTMWGASLSQQSQYIHNLTYNNANYLAHALQIDLRHIIAALSLTTAHWQTLDHFNSQLLNIDAKNHLQDLPGLISISIYNSNLNLHDFFINPSYAVSGQTDDQALITLLSNFKEKEFDEPVLIVSAQKNILVAFPLLNTNYQFLGILLADIDLPAFVDQIIPDFISNSYILEVFDKEQLIYKERPFADAKPIAEKISVSINSPLGEWTVILTPTQYLLFPLQSSFPTFILILGLFVSSVMTIMIIIAQGISLSKTKLAVALKDKEEALAYRQAILDSTRATIITTNHEGTILSFNKSAERMLLWKAEELVDRCSPEIFHDKKEIFSRAAELSEQLHRNIEPGFEVFIALTKLGQVDNKEWTYIRKDGSRFPVQLSITAVRNPKGDILGFMGIASDLTDFKELERLRKELITITSHEMRSPLASIKGSLDILSQQSLSEEAKQLVKIAHKNCERLVTLTTDILDLHKIEAGKLEFHFTDFSLVDLIQQCIENNSPLALQNHMTLEAPSTIPSCLIHGDKDRLMQVITNLISNAVKYSPELGKISFVLLEKGSFIRIGIKDQGPGIPQEFQHLLFQKFAQLPTSKKEGSGLGLSISQAIVQAHGGIMGFETSPEGSLFWFEIPIHK